MTRIANQKNITINQKLVVNTEFRKNITLNFKPDQMNVKQITLVETEQPQKMDQ